MEKKLLIVFIKNPKLGKVKTRLAESIGDEKALKIYNVLLDHTLRISNLVQVDKAIYYSDFIPASDHFQKSGFKQFLQRGNNLGERMSDAFRTQFIKGYDQIILIGSDCYDLDDDHLNEAFQMLEQNDLVVGPAKDGGYYLIGMKEHHPDLFLDIAWSTSTVFEETKSIAERLNLNLVALPVLSDIDELTDLIEYPELLGRI